MHIVGLTGGIACGKSTVASILARRGYPVVDADQLAREVVEPGRPAHAAIVDAFGEAVLDDAGAIDRRKLGEIVFSDPERRKQLERITHPAIAMAGQRRFVQLRAEGHAMGFYEAALLVETGAAKAMSALVVVSSSAENQRARLLARDADLSVADADARIASQMPLVEKEAAADVVIRNDGDFDDLEQAVSDMLAALEARFGQ